MRKIIVGGIAAALGVTTALATGVLAGGNGAARSGLSPNSGTSTNECQPGSGGGGNGFVIVNAPGKPGAARKLLSEVSLKNGTPDSTYLVSVVTPDNDNSDNNCAPQAMLETNGVGNGNAHISDPNLGSGSFYVVLQNEDMSEAFASGIVTVN